MLATDLALALDPAVAAPRLGLTLDPWQLDVLRDPADETILLCSRQSGKSSIAGLMAAHTAVYGAAAPILLLSPSLRQSQELFRKTRDACYAMGAGPIAEESALRIELASGARIISLPGKEATIRGYSGVQLLIVDEAARVADALYQAVRPMLAVSGGRLVLASTPFGKRGFFFQEWEEGGPHWKRTMVTAEQCPRIPRDWLQEERGKIGDWWYRQEYLCEFMEAQDSVFGYDEIMAALDPDVTPLFELVGA
jgi:hypothetical protein